MKKKSSKLLRLWVLSLAVLLFGLTVNTLSTKYVDARQAAVLEDVVHEEFQYRNWYSSISEVFLIASFLLFFYYVYKRKKYHLIPYFILASGVYQLVRGIFLPLTLIGSPTLEPDCFGILYKYLPDGGTFPSGHFGQAFLFFLFAERSWYKWLLLIIAINVGVFVVISRGHYSMDVLGALFIAYAIHKFLGDYFETE